MSEALYFHDIRSTVQRQIGEEANKQNVQKLNYPEIVPWRIRVYEYDQYGTSYLYLCTYFPVKKLKHERRFQVQVENGLGSLPLHSNESRKPAQTPDRTDELHMLMAVAKCHVGKALGRRGHSWGQFARNPKHRNLRLLRYLEMRHSSSQDN